MAESDAFEHITPAIRKRVLQAAPAGAPLARGRVTCRYESRAGSASGRVLDGATVALTLPEEEVPGADAVLPVPPGVALALRGMRIGETADLLLERSEAEAGAEADGAAAAAAADGGGASAPPPLFVRCSVLAAAEADFSPELDFGAMALRFHKEGNGLLAGSRDAEGAAAAYSQALSCVAMAERSLAAGGAGAAAAAVAAGTDAASLTKLRLVLHSNRAQALLKLARFDEAAAECDAALRLDGGHAKSLFRRARALLGGAAGPDKSAPAKFAAACADARALAALQSPPGREARLLMTELGLAHELPAEEEEKAAAPAAPAPEAPAAEAPAPSEADAAAAAAANGEKEGLLRQRRKGGGAGAAFEMGKAARKGFGSLYDDMPSVEELRKHEAERLARRAASRAGGAAGGDEAGGGEAAGCLTRMWRRVCGVIGCEPKRARKRAAGCC
jgi:hypothetical protein